MRLTRRNRQVCELDMWAGSIPFTRFEGEDSGGGVEVSPLESAGDVSSETGGDSGGGGDTDWRSGISEEYRDSQLVKDAKGMDDVVKGAIHAQSMVGRDKLVIPDENSTDEEVDAFHVKLGRPEKRDGYEFPDLELGESAKIDDKAVESFKDVCFKNGLPQRVMAEIAQCHGDSVKAQIEAVDTARKEQLVAFDKEMRDELGTAYDQKMTFGKMGVNLDGDDQLLKDLKETGAAMRPSVIRHFIKLGQQSQEDNIVNSGRSSNFNRSPAEAKAKIAERHADEKFMARYTGGDESARLEMMELHKAVNPPKVD